MMKKIFAALMLLFIPALMASCWKTGEDWSLCAAEDNFILKFRVQDGSDLNFQKNISSVNVYLFDADRKYLEQKHVDQSGLDEFQGVTFTVTPGIYHVVCWANASGNSHITAMSGSNNLENSYIEIASPQTGCPLYYAPYKLPETRSGDAGLTRSGDYSLYSVEVSRSGKTVKELTFSKVHRKVQVFISGYEKTSLYDGDGPIAEQTGAGGKYDFLLRADLTPVSLRQASAFGSTAHGNMHTAEMNSALIPVRSDMKVSLYHPADNSLIAEVGLEQYIADNNITDDSTIPIMFSFTMDAQVNITLPSWLNNQVDTD